MTVQRYLFYITQNYSFAILRPVQEAIREAGKEVVWFVEGNNVQLDYFRKDERRLVSVDQINNYMPEAILYPANTAPTFLPGINVAVFHGFDAGKVDKKGNNDHYKIRNCFDLYCTQGPDATAEFNSLQKQHPHFRVKETGWCALDPLFELAHNSLQNSNNERGRKTILLCSTFSKKLTCAPALLETIKQLSQDDKWQWLVQFHPKMDADIVTSYKAIQNDNLSFIETADVLPLLSQADVMVCDTSSVLIMFLLLNKPVVTFNNIAPQNHMLNISSADMLEQTIEQALSKPPQLMQNIQRFSERTHPYQDGQSSQRLLAAIDEVCLDKELIRKKPLDFFRQLKIRRKLNYWKLW